MSDVRELVDTSSIEALSPVELHQRYNALKAQLGPNPGDVADDDKLHEMVVILGALRRKSAGPPSRKSGEARGPKIEPSLDDL
jgi:hypothetical protein